MRLLLNVLAIFLLMPIAVSRQVVKCIWKDGEFKTDCMERVSKFATDVLEPVPDYYEKICLSDRPPYYSANYCSILLLHR